jgi:hypothetical protein
MKKLDIVVNPVASKFARALQQQLREEVVNQIYRRSTIKKLKGGRSRAAFQVVPKTLNKIEQFVKFQQNNISCPKAAVTIGGARNLNCKTLFARTLINSTNGRGIIEFESSSDIYPRAPLYTEYIPKKAEYRVHVFNGEVIDIQQKKKKRGFDGDRDTRVRNCANGYCYTRDAILPPDGIHSLAIAAVAAVGYQYGAVDIVYNEKRNQCFVLEVNSRPGLMGTTLQRYSEALIKAFNLTKRVK